MKIILFAFAGLFLFLASCSKEQLNKINTDPTKSSAENFNPDYLLATAQLRSGNIGYNQLLYAAPMMQILASTYFYYNNGDKYVNTANFTAYQGALFESSYSEVSTIREMQRLAKEKDSVAYSNLINIGNIMFVLIMQRATDIYGDIPYFQAAKAKEGIKYPVYDRQENIYPAMLKDLDAAINGLDDTRPKPIADLYYNGDLAKWRKFGRSLMVRIAMRLVKVNPDLARTWVEKAASEGTFTNLNDDAILPTDATSFNGRNSIAIAMRTTSDYREVRWSKTFIDFLRNNDDPRLGVIAEIPPPGLSNNSDQTLTGDTDPDIQEGLPNGQDLLGGATDVRNHKDYPGASGTGADAAPLGNYSRPRTSLYLKLDAPVFILTFAGTELLLAEAKIRGWNIPGSAANHYSNGVSAALQSLSQLDAAATITPEVITSYVKTHPLNESDPERAIEMINEQYWATTGSTFDFIEAWLNWKRSGYPRLTPVNYPGNSTNGTIPRRFPYLSTEVLNNPDNYKSAVSRLTGGDQLTSRVWWDR
ncbi:SusD/RagB family nutrient-binding outer membrane lipoprotein [Rubrolithibacter danxiaensis]|uniref:SusD/RagB family nutrient-binding outer membrane lipoprotein n=1 Tax=Rubrolithibacter danxiaensis TaxID=3390805 RepID=UPI003BF8961F